jgi:hypothetical protein
MLCSATADLSGLAHSSLMMEAVRTSETSVDNYFTWQYIPEDNSEHHTRRRENLKSHILACSSINGITIKIYCNTPTDMTVETRSSGKN